jgi:hypothetical protein
MQKILKALVALSFFVSVNHCQAAYLEYDLPEVVGWHGGQYSAVYDFNVTLGAPFSSITSASLRLSGSQVPGLAGSLIPSVDEYVVGADLSVVESPYAEFDPVLGHVFLGTETTLEFEEMFHSVFTAGLTNYSDWLDGQVGLWFHIGNPPLRATDFQIVEPLVYVQRATLIVDGVRLPEPVTELMTALILAVAVRRRSIGKTARPPRGFWSWRIGRE